MELDFFFGLTAHLWPGRIPRNTFRDLFDFVVCQWGRAPPIDLCQGSKQFLMRQTAAAHDAADAGQSGVALARGGRLAVRLARVMLFDFPRGTELIQLLTTPLRRLPQG